VGVQIGARILVVDDAVAIREALDVGLRSAGHDVLAREDGSTLERDLSTFRPDLVVLDVMLPGRDGFELLQGVRKSSDAGVVMLTARDQIDDRVQGLRGGADDYVVKPFMLAELIARVEAVLRRLGRVPATIQVGDLVVDQDGGLALRGGGDRVALTPTEFRLLSYLANNRDRVLTKTQILAAVWGYDDYDPNLVDVHVSGLRRKLEEKGPRLLHTVRGVGFVLRAAESV
jgi:two-component system OmpR family response regulator